MTDEEIIRLTADNDGRSRTELIDDMALPFLDLAEKIEAAKINNAAPESWAAIMETNLFLWRFISNFMPRHFSDEVSKDTVDLLEKISEFMAKVSVALAEQPTKDPALIDKIVQLNLNMCDQILAMRSEGEA
ncbi:MAG: hypothetical protein RIM33_13420 [Alphaproteobacteria bacterium]